MPEPTPSTGLPWRRPPCCCSLLLAASPWNFPKGSDGVAMLATAEALLYRGTLAVDDRFLADDEVSPSAMRGSDGRAYVKYGLGLPLRRDPAAGRRGRRRATSPAGRRRPLRTASAVAAQPGARDAHLPARRCARAAPRARPPQRRRAWRLRRVSCTFLSFHATTEGSDTLLALLLTRRRSRWRVTPRRRREARLGLRRPGWVRRAHEAPDGRAPRRCSRAAMVLAACGTRDGTTATPRGGPASTWFQPVVPATLPPAAVAVAGDAVAQRCPASARRGSAATTTP